MRILPDDAPMSFILPEKLKLSIADAVTLYSRLDQMVVDITILLTNKSPDDRKKIAKEAATSNIGRLTQRIEELGCVETTGLWEQFEQLRSDRNLIAHGSWLVVEDGQPHVQWYRIDPGGAEIHIVKNYTYERFEWFMRTALSIMQTLLVILKFLAARNGESDR